MSDDLGWVKLHRKIIDQPWFTNSNAVQLFMFLLLSVNRSEHKKIFYKGKEYALKAGEFWTTNERIGMKTGLSPMAIRHGVMLLKATNTITSYSSSKGTVYGLSQWSKYQQTTSVTTNQQQTNNKPTTTEQEVKKLRIKERTRTNSTRSEKCKECDDATGWIKKGDGVILASCECLDKKH